MEFTPIGTIHTPYQTQEDAPRQGRLAPALAEIELFPAYADGLLHMEQVSHLIVLYAADQADRCRLQTRTPNGTVLQGVFTCRSPNRPNPILICLAEIIKIDGCRITVRGLDALNGSPLLDLKPYIAALDSL